MTNNLTIILNEEVSTEVSFDIETFIRKAATQKGLETGSIEITFVNKDKIVEVNKAYLNHDYVTDIISFNLADTDEPIMGDLYICPDHAKQNAQEFENPFEQEVKLLLIHGILHLLGYEDYTDEQKAVMDTEQNRILHLIDTPND